MGKKDWRINTVDWSTRYVNHHLPGILLLPEVLVNSGTTMHREGPITYCALEQASDLHRAHAPWHSPGLNSTSSFKRVSSRSSMFNTRRGTTSFCNVTEATVATPELGLEGRITFPVLPNRSMSTYKCVGGGSVWGDIGGKGKGFLKTR